MKIDLLLEENTKSYFYSNINKAVISKEKVVIYLDKGTLTFVKGLNQIIDLFFFGDFFILNEEKRTSSQMVRVKIREEQIKVNFNQEKNGCYEWNTVYSFIKNEHKLILVKDNEVK